MHWDGILQALANSKGNVMQISHPIMQKKTVLNNHYGCVTVLLVAFLSVLVNFYSSLRLTATLLFNEVN